MSQLYFKSKKDGRLFEVDGEQPITFNPQGGGFVSKVPLSQFLLEFDLVTSTKAAKLYGDLRPAMVIGDWPNGGPFHCYLDEQRWNGWRLPYFNLQTLLLVSPEQVVAVKGNMLSIAIDGHEQLWKP